LPELDGAGRVHAETVGDNGVQVVEARRVVLAVLGSMSEIPTDCFFIEFFGLEDVFQMLGDGAPALVE
jgi:hypothetical protein